MKNTQLIHDFVSFIFDFAFYVYIDQQAEHTKILKINQ